MTTLEHFVSPALTRALGWTLVHSLWQGALVAAVLAGALLLLRRQRAEVRYAASAGALGVVVALAGITFGLYFNSSPKQGPLPGPDAAKNAPATPVFSQSAATTIISKSGQAANEAVAVPVGAGPNAPAYAAATIEAPASVAPSKIHSFTNSLIHSLNEHLPLLVLAWLLGLLAMSLRMLGGLLYVQRLRRYRVRPLPAVWQERLAALAARSGVRRPVALLESALVQVPLVVGHLRPMILLPLGTVAGLSPACLEAILAHELAHVLRRDYLVNLLQTVAEVLFFYHPAVWFVAGCVRTERENCCDDTATALVGGDPLRLARALTALAEWSHSAVVPTAPRLALAAIGQQNALLNRIRRLVVRRPAAPTLAEGLMAGALVLGGLGLLGGSVALAGPLTNAVLPTVRPLMRAHSAARFTPSTSGPNAAEALPVAEAMTSEADTNGVRKLTLLPNGRARAMVNGVAVEFDTLLNSAIMRRGRRPTGPGEVVITRDKKGRITGLVVNGQPVAVPTEKLTKDERRAGQQVTVVSVPSAGRRSYNYSTLETDQTGRETTAQGRELDRAGRELDKAGRKLDKMGREMDQAAQKLDRKSDPYIYTSRRRNGQNSSDLHIDIDDNALGELVTNALRLGNVGLNIGLQAASQGIDEARRSLEETLRDPSLSSEARRATRDALTELRQEQGRSRREGADQAQEARDRRQELQDRIRESQQELQEIEQGGARQDREQATRDREQATRDREQVIRDREQVIRDRERAGRDRERADHGRDRNDALMAQMQKDGIIKDPNHYQVKLTARSLVIDGKEQPAKVFQKYLKLYETNTGRKLTGNNAMVVTRSSDSSTIIDSNGPTPPRAPLAAPAPPALNAPAPPRPPRVDTESLRAELRKDGLIGADEKDMQFQLNGSGLTVNGKKQSDELAAKYRRLTGHDDGKNFNMMISTQE